MNNKHKFQEDDFVGRWISQTLSEAEAMEFEKWLAANPAEKRNFEELKKTWESYGEIKLNQGSSKDERWQQISQRANLTPETHAAGKSLTTRTIPFAAAAVILISLISYWTLSRLESIVAPPGSRISEFLPDGSEVVLNSESSLKYDPKKWQEKREVILAGEAFFKVESMATPFLVKTDLSTTRVLGTTFNIKARGQAVEVACLTGKVSVESNKKTQGLVVLHPGFASMIFENRKPSAPYHIDIDQIAGWTRGEIYFRSMALNQVFEEIARQFDVDFEIRANLGNLTFTGRITDSDILQALDTVCLSSGLKYQKKTGSAFTITE